jgi:hypothetical protein
LPYYYPSTILYTILEYKVRKLSVLDEEKNGTLTPPTDICGGGIDLPPCPADCVCGLAMFIGATVTWGFY